MKLHAHTAIHRRRDFLQLPGLVAHKAMLTQSFPCAEPGENNRHAAANRLPVLEAAALAQEQQRRLALLLKMCDVRAVQINLRHAPRRADFHHRQIAAPFLKGDAAGS